MGEKLTLLASVPEEMHGFRCVTDAARCVLTTFITSLWVFSAAGFVIIVTIWRSSSTGKPRCVDFLRRGFHLIIMLGGGRR